VKRAAIGQLIDEHRLSERRACRLVGLSRDSYRHPPVANAQTEALKTRIVEIAHARRRFGYRRVHDLLRVDFPGINPQAGVPAVQRCRSGGVNRPGNRGGPLV
jgi:putative transposase